MFLRNQWYCAALSRELKDAPLGRMFLNEPVVLFRNAHGAAFALEGDPGALRAGRRLARALGGMPVVIRGRDKARYHAGAVFASNYVVTLLDAAQRLLVSAGFSERAARRALAPLTAASVENEAAHGAVPHPHTHSAEMEQSA